MTSGAVHRGLVVLESMMLPPPWFSILVREGDEEKDQWE